MPICTKLASSMKAKYGERAEEVYHRFANTPRGKAAIAACIKKHGSSEAFDWGSRKGGESMEPGGGGRFKRLVGQLKARRKEVTNPKALAAWIGRRKWGRRRMARWAAKGRAKEA